MGQQVPGSAAAPDSRSQLPPGQRLQAGWPVLHYGPVPRFKPDTWEFQAFGCTASARQSRWSHAEFCALPQEEVVADFHCVTRFSMLENTWGGVRAASIATLAPPADDVTHVMVWAEYGFSSNIRIDDFLRETTIFASTKDGEPLTPEHGFPLRLIVPHLYAWKGPKWVRGVEYMVGDRRGFWEERGYHNVGDPWQQQRYSYQEEPGDGPVL